MKNHKYDFDVRHNSRGGFAAGGSREYLQRAELAEAQLAGIVDLADVGVIVFNVEGGIRLVNDRFARLIGAEGAAISEARNWTQLGPAIADRFREPVAFLKLWRERMERDGDASWDELELSQPHGGTLERFGRPLFSPGGKSIGRLEIYRDTSVKRVLEKKLLQSNKLAGLGQLIAGIMHELNNPLTGILGYAQILLSRGLAPEPAAEARQIYQEADRASRIVRNFLLFAHEKRVESAPVNLNQVAERTVALRRHQLRLENIRMDLDLDPRLPSVIADAGQLQQVALNLVINAEQAIARDNSSGTIRLRTALLDHDRVILEISDTGPGIDAEILPNIFDPFFTTKPSGMGTGLGLSVAFGIVHDHGGQLSVQSELGRGAKFTIELAAASILQPALATVSTALTESVPRSAVLRHERVLVIEDEPTVARFIADVLGEDSHVVETALDSRDGLGKALEFRYDLLICDLKMPYPDGRAIYEELLRRHSPVTQRMIFVTGDTLGARTLDFLEFAGLPYLAKPFRVEDLKNTVAKLLARTRRRAEAGISPVERRRG